jgi:outer membrane protein assembly complex protein YaeT
VVNSFPDLVRCVGTQRLFGILAVTRRFHSIVFGAVVVLGGGGRSVAAQEQGLVIRQLRFEGNSSIPSEVLEAAIATTNSAWFARNLRFLGLGTKRRLNEREFRVDVLRIRLFYQRSGFLDAQVDTVVVRTAENAYITFKITEGEPIRVKTLTIGGLDSFPDRDKLVRDLPLTVGMPYNRFLFTALVDTITTRLYDRGFPTPSVTIPPRPVDTVAKTVALEVVADPGAPAVFGPIRIQGTRAVDTSFVRALLATRSGAQFRASDIYRSQLNLYQSGLFRYATVATDTTRFTLNEPVVPMIVEVQEGPLHRARAGLGIGTSDCLRASAGWTARNFFGRGRQIDFLGSVSKLGVVTDPLRSTVCSGLEEDTIGSRRVNYGLTASLRRPAFLAPSNAITGTVFAERRSEYKVFLRDEVGASLNFTRVGFRGIPVSLTYRVSYGSTQANAVSFCALFLACRQEDIDQLRERRMSASITGSLSRQRVNNLVDPTRGSVYTFELTFSSPLIGSTRFSEFTRVVTESSWYRPLGGDVVLATHLRGGVIFAPRLRLRAGAANFVPPEQRFYGGGSNDVRGFDRNELGPLVYLTPASNIDSVGGAITRDSVQAAPIGGNTTVIGNAELRLPSPFFAGRLRWAVFVDAGSVWERGSATAPALRVTPGIGIRYASPLGPMRLDVAYAGSPLTEGALYAIDGNSLTLVRNDYRQPLGGRFNVQVSVGQAF